MLTLDGISIVAHKASMGSACREEHYGDKPSVCSREEHSEPLHHTCSYHRQLPMLYAHKGGVESM